MSLPSFPLSLSAMFSSSSPDSPSPDSPLPLPFSPSISNSNSPWWIGRSMRTVRSNLYQNPSQSGNYNKQQNITDAVIDIHLKELSKTKSPENSFILIELSHAFSACSSSDISGELQRLAKTEYRNKNNNDNQSGTGDREREDLATEIMESISQKDIHTTVKICVQGLQSTSNNVKRYAAEKIRMLAKNRADNRELIGQLGAVPKLINLLRCNDPWTQENAVTAILNLSLHEGNKELMSDPLAVKSLIYVLKTGTETSKQNAACALLNLSLTDEENRMSIGACGAIPPLVSLLMNGSTRGKKDALTTLYKLCGAKVNKERAVSAGVVGPLVGMVAEQGSGLAEKAMVVLSSLAAVEEGREAIVEEGGIAGLVEAIEDSSEKGKEFAVMTLLQLCGDSVRNRGLLVREGGIPPLAALAQSGTLKAKHKAETLLKYLREPRQEASTSTSP